MLEGLPLSLTTHYNLPFVITGHHDIVQLYKHPPSSHPQQPGTTLFAKSGFSFPALCTNDDPGNPKLCIVCSDGKLYVVDVIKEEVLFEEDEDDGDVGKKQGGGLLSAVTSLGGEVVGVGGDEGGVGLIDLRVGTKVPVLGVGEGSSGDGGGGGENRKKKGRGKVGKGKGEGKGNGGGGEEMKNEEVGITNKVYSSVVLEQADYISSLLHVPTTSYLFACSGDGTVCLYDIRFAQTKLAFSSVSDNIEDDLLCMTSINNGARLVCGTLGGSLQIYTVDSFVASHSEVLSEDHVVNFRGHPGAVNSVCGIDNGEEGWVVTGGDDGMIRVVDLGVRVEGEVPSALPLPQVQRDKNGKAEKLKPSALRDLVLETWQVQGTFVRYVAEWDNWYVYDGGVYKLVLDKEMRRRVDLILEAQEQDLSEHALSGVLAKIQRSVSVFIERGPKPAAYLNLKNGLLDVETQILSPHSSDVFSVTQTNTVYDEKASCPKFMTFIERVCPDPMNRLVLQEFLGYILSPRHNLQKALYLEGEAGTGKGTLTTDVMAALLGDVDTDYSLVSTMSLGALQDGEHTLVNAVNKRLIIVSETERNDSLLGFKKITGGDPMLVNPKNKTPYSARIEAKIIITTNEPIFTGSDATNSSIDRRLIILPFNVKQRPEDKNPNIGKELTTPEELSGVLNWCLEGYQRLKANGFMFSSDGDKEHRIEFLSSSNPVIDFLREDATPVEGAQIGSTELYNAWVDWAAGVDNGYGRKGGAGHLPTSQKKFAKKFEAAAAALGWEVEKSRDSVTRRYIWQGVALRKL